MPFDNNKKRAASVISTAEGICENRIISHVNVTQSVFYLKIVNKGTKTYEIREIRYDIVA